MSTTQVTDQDRRHSMVDAYLTGVYRSPKERGGRGIYARAFRKARCERLAGLRRVGR